MANWRKIHVGDDEWNWVISKGYMRAVVIREPNKGKCHTVPLQKIDPVPSDIQWDHWDEHWEETHAITPAKIKAYIEQNLV